MTTLVTVQDLGTVSDEDEALAACILASGIVLDYLGRPVLSDEYVDVLPVHADVVVRDGQDAPSGLVGTVQLPVWPVDEVDSVSVGGVELDDDQWSWDASRCRVLIDDPGAYEATVTYTAGYPVDDVPAGLRAVTRRLALWMLSNPGGVRSEQIGDYSVTYGGGIDLSTLERRILDRYRSSAGTIRPS